MQWLDIALTVINIIAGSLSILAIPIVRLFAGKKINKSYKENFDSIIIASIAFVITIAISIWNLATSVNKMCGAINAAVSLLIAMIVFIYNLFQYNKKAKIQITELDNVINGNSQKYKLALNGVFAVSAIIVTPDNKFLLVKRKPKDGEATEDVWIQPGAYYRTSQYVSEKSQQTELESFYSYLLSRMEAETGLKTTEVDPILCATKKDEPTFAGENLEYSADYRNNMISSPPFLVQKEKSDKPKTSGATIHIDCFFAFKLKKEATSDFIQKLMAGASEKESKYSAIQPFSYSDIKNMVKKDRDNGTDKCYNDLYVIIGKFLHLWRKNIFNEKFKNNIRYCTFNPENNTLWIRIHNNCNLACKFCLMTNRCKVDPVSPVSDVNTEAITQHLDPKSKQLDKNDYKVVITGGEPFLTKNLFNLVSDIKESIGSKIKKITICTNGTMWLSHKNNILSLDNEIKNKLSFVINLSGYNDSSYMNITTSNSFSAQKEFISFLQAQGIDFVANVVMTKMLNEHLTDYFDFWQTTKIKKIAFSYAIRKGINARKADCGVLSKVECIKLYEKIGDGRYPIEYFDEIELMIPSCDECDCKENSNIISIYENNYGSYGILADCLDKNSCSEEKQNDRT